jgi:peptidoglycan/xylan/chitin deacetylase (PgdA/CDA1 family)
MTADAGLVAHMLAGPPETTLGRAVGHPQLLGRYRALVGAPDRPVVAVSGDQVILGELSTGLPDSPARPEAIVARAVRRGVDVTCQNAVMSDMAEVLAFQRARGAAIVGVLREHPDLLPLSTAGSWFFASWRVRLVRRALLPLPPRALAWLGVSGARLAIDVAFWQGVKEVATSDEWACYTLDSYVTLCYHRLAGEYRPGEERIDVSPRIFARHLRILRVLRLRPVSAEALRSFHDLANRRRLGSYRRVVVTADDGFTDCIDVFRARAAELRGAQVFVPTAAVGGEAWWAHGEPVAAWDGLRALTGSGVTVGSHGRRHRPFTELDGADLTSELVGSATDLRQLGPALPVLAYPHGAHNLRVRAAAQAAGYTLAFTTAPGRNGAGIDRWCLRRVTPKAWDSRLSFAFKALTGEPLPWRWEVWRMQCFQWRRRAAAILRTGR